jgi:hypothetical protein
VKRKELRWKLKIIEGSLRPTLSYVPRGLENFTDHGCGHSERIIASIDDIIPKLKGSSGLNTSEEFLLRSLAWTHDLGCIVSRKDHAARSAQILRKHFRDIEGIGEYVPVLAPLSRAHSDDHRPENRIMSLSVVPIRLGGEMVRLRYLAALFRLLDACDASYQRGPKLVMKILSKEMNVKDRLYWKAHTGIIGVLIDPEAGKIILYVENKRKTAIVQVDIERSVREVGPTLCDHGWPDLKVESIQISKDKRDLGE